MPMRIALLSWESMHSIAVGGLAPHVSELAAALQRRGHEVHVFTRIGPRQLGYENILGVHYHRCPYQTHDDFLPITSGCATALSGIWLRRRPSLAYRLT